MVTSVVFIKIDEYLDGGWNQYDQNISDHRPVAMKILIANIPSYDFNDDGSVNNQDLTILISSILGETDPESTWDINFDSVVNVYDLFYLSDYLQDI